MSTNHPQGNITICKEHEFKVDCIVNSDEDFKQTLHIESSSGYVIYQFNEIKGGILKWLPQLLEQGICYDYEWSDGDDVDPGIESLRFTEEGNVIFTEVFKGNENPSLDTLMTYLDKPELLVDYIKGFYERVTPMSKEKQVEYGQTYLAKKLLNIEIETTYNRT
jgi:hypothetical protein